MFLAPISRRMFVGTVPRRNKRMEHYFVLHALYPPHNDSSIALGMGKLASFSEFSWSSI